MKQSRDHRDHLDDIFSAAYKALEFVTWMDYAHFLQDDKTAYAVVRFLEILGEATKRIPAEILDRFPESPCRSMVAMRDNFIHKYVSVNM